MNLLMPWREVSRRWSLWLALTGGALLAFFQFAPDQALAVWKALPHEWTEHISQRLGFDAGVVLVVLAKLAMFINQKAVNDQIESVLDWLRRMSNGGNRGQ